MDHVCVLASIVLAAAAVSAGPVASFPARFTDHEHARAVATATKGGRTARTVRRADVDDVLVFDDATRLHFEIAPEWPYPVEATWRATSPRVVVFRYTPETAAATREYIRGLTSATSRIRIRNGRARLVFSRNLASYRGRQVIRAATTYRGARVTVVETVTYTGTREAD